MTARHWSIRPSSNLFGRQGGYVGSVEAATETTLRVRGATPDRIYYIPVEAVVAEIARDRYELDCSAQDVPYMGWERPPTAPSQSIGLGTYVYGSNGEFVGKVEFVDADHIRVRGPLPMTSVYYIPISAVAGAMGAGREVFLNCSKDQLSAKAWLLSPHRAQPR